MNRSNVGKIWTHEDFVELRSLFRAGLSLEDMCERMGRTPAGIISKLVDVKAIFVGKDGHYYPYPEDPWMSWQEVRHLSDKWKTT